MEDYFASTMSADNNLPNLMLLDRQAFALCCGNHIPRFDFVEDPVFSEHKVAKLCREPE